MNEEAGSQVRSIAACVLQARRDGALFPLLANAGSATRRSGTLLDLPSCFRISLACRACCPSCTCPQFVATHEVRLAGEQPVLLHGGGLLGVVLNKTGPGGAGRRGAWAACLAAWLPACGGLAWLPAVGWPGWLRQLAACRVHVTRSRALSSLRAANHGGDDEPCPCPLPASRRACPTCRPGAAVCELEGLCGGGPRAGGACVGQVRRETLEIRLKQCDREAWAASIPVGCAHSCVATPGVRLPGCRTCPPPLACPACLSCSWEPECTLLALAYEHTIELCRTRPAFERFASISIADSVAGVRATVYCHALPCIALLGLPPTPSVRFKQICKLPLSLSLLPAPAVSSPRLQACGRAGSSTFPPPPRCTWPSLTQSPHLCRRCRCVCLLG